MRVVFFGSPTCALPSLQKLLEVGHSIPLIITQPDKPMGRGQKVIPSAVKRFALEKGIPYMQPEKIRKDAYVMERLEAIQPDLNVVVAYGQIIPAAIIYLPKYNSLNVHFSLLPKYRGASPVQGAILNGEEKTGVTIFELNEKMDEGDILAQEEVPIFPDEKASELEMRLAHIGAELLIKTISRIDHIQHRKQDHSLATYAPKLSKEDGKIDWTKEALFIQRQIRALNPWPSTYTFFQGQRIKIIEGKALRGKSHSAQPGQIQSIGKEGIEVCCGGRTVFLVEKVQPENKNSITAFAFSLGKRLKPGDLLG